jgi:hypothetical protein
MVTYYFLYGIIKQIFNLKDGELMRKNMFKAFILCASLLFITGIINSTLEANDPGPIGYDSQIIHCI